MAFYNLRNVFIWYSMPIIPYRDMKRSNRIYGVNRIQELSNTCYSILSVNKKVYIIFYI